MLGPAWSPLFWTGIRDRIWISAGSEKSPPEVLLGAFVRALPPNVEEALDKRSAHISKMSMILSKSLLGVIIGYRGNVYVMRSAGD